MPTTSTATALYPTFDDFVKEWKPKLETLSADMYLRGQDIEDCVAELLEEFWVRDYLSVYDPEKGTIATFVYGFAKPRIKGFRARFLTHMRKTAKELDGLEEWQIDQAADLVDQTDWQKPLDHSDLLVCIRERLAELPNPEGAQFTHLVLFDLMYAQARQGEVNFSDIAYHLGISPSAVTGYRKRLQVVMGEDEVIENLLGDTDRWARLIN